VEEGSVALPYHFEHTDIIPEINRDARTISQVQIQGREVTMKFILWDKRTWVRGHKERVSSRTQRVAQGGYEAYVQELNSIFVQYEGEPGQLLWFGDIIQNRLLQGFDTGYTISNQQRYQERSRLARNLGFSSGCKCSRPALLAPSDQWFSKENVHQDGDYLFEPESLYRGVLFGAALAMIALSNGSRVSELLQVSWNKERRITRTETVVVVGEDGQPVMGNDGKPLTKHVKIHLQHLLPKGSKTEEERQLFPAFVKKRCGSLVRSKRSSRKRTEKSPLSSHAVPARSMNI
jgi:hypothetical protein